MTAIAIDGPAGAGKSTIARALAQKLGYLYLDTGALYRAIGLYCVERGVPTGDKAAVTAALDSIDVALRYVDGAQRVLLNGEDVSEAIRRPEISLAASAVSAMDTVRAFLLDLQRDMARTHDVVMDGRDIGTVVLPDADVKIFLTAAPEDRARRRFLELEQRGTPQEYDQLLAEIKQRDYNDAHRASSPLRQAEDALLLDTTGNTFEQSLALLLKTIREKL